MLKQGVQVEECAVSMKAHHWVNEDLLPGVKVNAGTVGTSPSYTCHSDSGVSDYCSGSMKY